VAALSIPIEILKRKLNIPVLQIILKIIFLGFSRYGR